jgi:hypothetical protein
MIPKHEQLIEQLVTKTKQGSINWESTDAQDQYVLRLKQGAILFDKFQASSLDFGVIAMGSEPTYSYRFTIVNNEGEEIDHVTIRRSDNQYIDIAQIFYGIYRKVNRIDEQLDEIISELGADESKESPS